MCIFFLRPLSVESWFLSCHAASEDHGSVTLSSWLQFCSDARIMDNNHKGCTRADLAVSAARAAESQHIKSQSA